MPLPYEFFIDYLTISFYAGASSYQKPLRISFYKAIESVEAILSQSSSIHYFRIYHYPDTPDLIREIPRVSSAEGRTLDPTFTSIAGTIHVCNYSLGLTATHCAVGLPTIRFSQESYKVLLTLFVQIFLAEDILQFMRITRIDFK